jgi:ribosome-binding protein aMBF1 (putative translation factor)
MIMVKLSESHTADEIHERHMRDDPDYAAEYKRTEFANEVAIAVIRYRTQHNLSQTGLAAKLGMRQPNIARLEAADHEPSLTMLERLARVLGLDFHIEITPEASTLRTRHHRRGQRARKPTVPA